MTTETAVTQVPVLDGMFAWPTEVPRLLASRCTTCGTHTFPRTFICPNPACIEREVEDAELSPYGTLASYTVVHYPPPRPFVPPDPFVPFILGEVAFPEGIQVVGPVVGVDLDAVRLGIAVETVIEPYSVTEDGVEVVGWKFRPVEEAS